MPATTIDIAGEQETLLLGQRIARALTPPVVLSLDGPLGAGKTRLVQAIACELGVGQGEVTSPTYVLVNEYTTGRVPVYHFDAYRLADEDEFLQLGPEEYFDGAGGKAAGVTCVEWGDRVACCLPTDRVRVAIEILQRERRRVVIDDPASRLVWK